MADDKKTEGAGSRADESMPLQKYLARAGIDSRRKCEEHIRNGRVSVDGNRVTEMGVRVVPGVSEVLFDGVSVFLREEKVVLMLNKPSGYVTTMSDERGRATVADLVPCDRYPGLFAVGRLDLETTGLLLFTNDGDLCQALLHPTRHVDKTYEARVQGIPSEDELDVLRRGGLIVASRPIQPAEVSVMSRDRRKNQSVLSVRIHEGRKRQVRKMCKAISHPVIHLHRSSFGPLELGDLPEGEWRTLSPDELAALRAVL